MKEEENMKKITVFAIAMMLALALLAGCTTQAEGPAATTTTTIGGDCCP